MLGRVDLIEQPNGVVVDYDYDALDRVETLRHFTGDPAGTALVYDAGTDTLLAEQASRVGRVRDTHHCRAG